MSEQPLQQETQRVDDEIDLRELMETLWRHRWLITAVFAVAVLTAGIISFTMAPVYQVHATISPGRYDAPIYTSPGPIREVILSDDFMLGVVEDLNLDIPREEFGAFKDAIGVEPVPDTDMFRITVETTDRAEGRAVLEQIFENFLERSRPHLERQRDLVTGQLETLQETLAQVDDNIDLADKLLAQIEAGGGAGTLAQDFRRSQLLESRATFEQQRLDLLDRCLGLQRELNVLEGPQVIQSPQEPLHPIKPNQKLNMTLAGVLGLMVGVFLAFGVEFWRRKPAA